VLHDPGRPFSAEDSLIDRVIPIPFDVSNVTIFEVYIDPTTARTHVAGGLTDLIADFGLSINRWLGFHYFSALIVYTSKH